ncbi:hypothetical protein NKH77_44465 [Streptomyces sp. M19]
MMLEEEYRFRRTGRYRHTSFAQAKALVYDDAAFMAATRTGCFSHSCCGPTTPAPCGRTARVSWGGSTGPPTCWRSAPGTGCCSPWPPSGSGAPSSAGT